MMTKIGTRNKLWVDDIRPLPSDLNEDEWFVATTFHQSICILESNHIDEISLDHDLGPESVYGYKEMTGYDIVQWLCARKLENNQVPTIYYLHTANPVGRDNMQASIDAILI